MYDFLHASFRVVANSLSEAEVAVSRDEAVLRAACGHFRVRLTADQFPLLQCSLGLKPLSDSGCHVLPMLLAGISDNCKYFGKKIFVNPSLVLISIFFIFIMEEILSINISILFFILCAFLRNN